MNLELSTYHRRQQEEFRRFAAEELDRGEHFPRENLIKAARKGYMGLPLPPEWGGRGEDFLCYALLVEELSRVCAATGLIIAVHTSVGTFPLYYYGSEKQKKRYLPGLAGGELLGAFALTEQQAGSDAAALETLARRTKDGYCLDGCKLFITSGGEADLYTVFATVNRDLGHRGITAFLVEKGFKGLHPGRPERKMGLNRSSTSELRMEDLQVPLSNKLGKEGAGFGIAMSLLDGGRIGIAAQGLGLAGAAVDFVAAHLKQDRVMAGVTGEAASFILADLATRLQAARLLVYRAAMSKDAGKKCSAEAAMAKYYTTDLAVEAASRAIDLCGPRAALADSFPTTCLCDAKATQIYEGTNQVQRMVVARELLGK